MNVWLVGTRPLAWLRRAVERSVRTLPYFPDPKAKCPAHGRRFCRWCALNPASCSEDDGGCGYWSATGMHWDTCPNRIRG